MNIKDFIKEKQWKKWRKDQWIVIFLIGVLLLVIAMPVGSKSKTDSASDVVDSKTQQETTGDDGITYEELLESRLEAILRNVDGVGQVEVMITLKDNGESVVEKDVESSYNMSDGGSSEAGDQENQILQQQTSEVTVYENQTDEAGPFVSKENRPEIEGVLVAAQGGGNAATAQNISEAIQALFDIEVHKIKVVKMNAQEGTN